MSSISSAIVPEACHIDVDHVSVVFGTGTQQVTALSDVTFQIQSNEFVSLLGPSGCGKSTLLRLVGDLLQPTSGTVRIAGQEPERARLQRQFGIVFQTPALFDWRTVRHNVELPLELLGTRRKECRRISSELLEMVGLTRFADHYPWQLSGGCSNVYPLHVHLRLIHRCCSWMNPFPPWTNSRKKSFNWSCLRSSAQQARPSSLSHTASPKPYFCPTGSSCSRHIRGKYIPFIPSICLPNVIVN